jgi:hypothetical protein
LPNSFSKIVGFSFSATAASTAALALSVISRTEAPAFFAGRASAGRGTGSRAIWAT